MPQLKGVLAKTILTDMNVHSTHVHVTKHYNYDRKILHFKIFIVCKEWLHIDWSLLKRYHSNTQISLSQNVKLHS